MIDLRKLKELIRLMVNNELTELDLRDSEEQVTLRRQPPQPPAPAMVPMAAPAAMTSPPVPAGAAAAPAADPGAGGGGGGDDDGLLRIESPIVGTFYAAPNPDAGPFVSVGDRVSEETTVCIIEAMKIFNEIKAETSGTIDRVLVGNGDAVEFGQPLFLVRPD